MVAGLASPATSFHPLPCGSLASGVQSEGYLVEYERLPITDGRAPKNRDLDAIAARVGACDPETAFVFNCQVGSPPPCSLPQSCLECSGVLALAHIAPYAHPPLCPSPLPGFCVLQMGRGRTTTGTVVATLVLVRCLYGRPLVVPAHLRRSATPPRAALAAPLASPAAGMDIDGPPLGTAQGTVGAQGGLGALGGVGAQGAQGEEGRGEKRMRMSSSDEAPEGEGGPDLFDLEDVVAVRRITRLLPLGEPSRKVLDAVIDLCAVMQNIREAVLRYRQTFNLQVTVAPADVLRVDGSRSNRYRSQQEGDSRSCRRVEGLGFGVDDHLPGLWPLPLVPCRQRTPR